ncbi:hypothetical protein JAAARDRAFT_204220 [Jaapia argillacea MUCL 33604]|uniref:Peptidase M20 dimerisation domain-containing protein n=1 Tax=Jaapia argillacea MUCL 33604 TaxID=933084 RepID=A0A067Q6I7_9AGAM|nr:hypothetical protein JAAARDRAFT_204220 [Jaapia argillacea MUCL 33604]
MKDHSSLPYDVPQPRKKSSYTRVFARVGLLVLCACLLSRNLFSRDFSFSRSGRTSLFSFELFTAELKDISKAVDLDVEADAACTQVAPLVPSKNGEIWEKMNGIIGSGAFGEKAVEWLGGAVRVPTESYDKMEPVGVDPRWEAFGPFHDYLLGAYPLIHSTLELTKVNTYGLVYVWKGSDESLKPLLLAAHQDVVPVDQTTLDQWEHPPYSGYFDGERIWGRGSSDDKSGLIGIMSTIETLLSNGFEPSRSVVLAFGFDEEASGLHGASALGKYMLSTFGEYAFSMLVDEGGGFSEQFGGVFAVPGVAEKGYLDVRVEVTSPGGHSSIPPPHTSIGILSSLLVAIESNPYPVHLNRSTPPYATIQCLASHAPSLPSSLRSAIKGSLKSDEDMKRVEEVMFRDRAFRSMVGTTLAIDLIEGGVKTNALPERAWGVVNHRIATDSSVAATQEHDTDLLRSYASQFNLTYTAFGSVLSEADAPAYGTLTLSDAWGAALEPAPTTPTDADAVPYGLLSGSIRATYNAHRGLGLDGSEIIVSPGIMTGNTDTRYYWKLTEHIFRYNHANAGSGPRLSGVHTVNESIKLDGFLEIIRFFSTLILNADESRKM